ncbi:MAG: PsiF family protein [Rhodanobacter sp.]
MSMSLRLLATTAAFAFAGAAFAAAPQDMATPTTKPHTAQQERMIDCNKQATEKHGAERKTFMSACLKGHTASAMPTARETQQQKMKTCNADAKTKLLKGAERKSFMSTCLKGDAAPPPAGH